MNTFLTLLFSLAVPTFWGYTLIKILFRRVSLPGGLRLAIAYGLGLGILAHAMLGVAMLGGKLNLLNIAGPPTLLSLLTLWWGCRQRSPHAPTAAGLTGDPGKQSTTSCGTPTQGTTDEKFDFPDHLLIGFLSFHIIFVFWSSLNFPIFEWDSVATHSFIAKILFYERSLALHKNFPHAIYPLLVPFIQTWIALCLGAWHDIFVKLAFPFLFSSYLVIQYYFLRPLVSRRWALIGLCLLVTANFFTHHATSAYRDFTLTYYNCTTVLFFLFWLRTRQLSWIFLAGLMSGFASFTKAEALGYIGIHSIILLAILFQTKPVAFKSKLAAFLLFFLPCAGIAACYQLYTHFILIPQLPPVGPKPNVSNVDLGHLAICLDSSLWARVQLVSSRFFDNLFLSDNWNLLWFILLVSLGKGRWKKFSAETNILLFSTGLYLGVYWIAFTFTQYYVGLSEKNTLLSRAVLHFFPLAVPLIVLIHAPQSKKNFSP